MVLGSPGPCTHSLNTITQPLGIMLVCLSTFGFVKRSSPIVCASPTIHLVFLIAKETFLLKSSHATLLKVARYRFRGVDEIEEGNLVNL